MLILRFANIFYNTWILVNINVYPIILFKCFSICLHSFGKCVHFVNHFNYMYIQYIYIYIFGDLYNFQHVALHFIAHSIRRNQIVSNGSNDFLGLAYKVMFKFPATVRILTVWMQVICRVASVCPRLTSVTRQTAHGHQHDPNSSCLSKHEPITRCLTFFL